MNHNIRLMRRDDKPYIIQMMRDFYSSPAVFSNGSEEIFENDFENSVGDNPFIEGYTLEYDDKIVGYAMIAKSYSTEFGKACMWIEDLYIEENYRGLGIGKSFFDLITKKYTDCIFRLEVEEENEGAVRLYKKCGFSVLPYVQLKK